MDRIELTILKNLIYNEDFSHKVTPFIKDTYFSDRSEKIVFQEIMEFINKYKALPSYEALVININDLKGINQQDINLSIEVLDSLKNNRDEYSDLQWLLDSTEKFCQDKAIYNAIMESVYILEGDKQTGKNKGEIPKLLSDALGISFDSNVGHDYLEDYDKRYDVSHLKEERIPVDLELLGKITRGGFPKKTLNLIMSSTTGLGKTLFKCHLASHALSQGFNVLYISMEISEEKIADRIDANLLNIKLDELHKIPKEEYSYRLNKLKSKINGKLIIKEFPTASASVLHFRHLLDELKLKKRFVPDIIFIDYLNICASSRIKAGSGSNSYSYIKSVAEEIRGLAVEYNVPIVSSTQGNRSAIDSSDIDLTNVSDSIGISYTVDWMIAIISNEELEGLGQIMIKQLKNRYADMNYYKRFVVGVDKPKMRLYDVETGAQKDIIDSGQGETENSGFNSLYSDRKNKNKFEGLKV